MQSIRLYTKLVAMVGLTSVGVPLQWLALRLGARRMSRGLPVVFHKSLCRVLGIRVIVRGTPPRGQPTLIVSNHVSWADIAVISSVLPVSFIAKSEIAGWPLFGTLARLQRSVFVDRTRRQATGQINATIASRLGDGEAIVLFGEGTTGDGIRVLPFRSALVGAAREAIGPVEAEAAGGGPRDGAVAAPAIALQPLCVTYVARDGLPLGRAERAGIAWYGDMDLAPHLLDVLRGGPYDVVVDFGEPISFGAGSDRKTATRRAEEHARAATRAAFRGHR